MKKYILIDFSYSGFFFVGKGYGRNRSLHEVYKEPNFNGGYFTNGDGDFMKATKHTWKL